MLTLDIPGFKNLRLEHLLLDYNGTLALDGQVVEGVMPRLAQLAQRLEVHVLTADTHGSAAANLAGSGHRLHVLEPGDEARAKLAYLLGLGAERSAAMGNGRNDRLMLERAVLGVAVLGQEGVAGQTLASADMVCPGILPALDLLLKPRRLLAGLRS